MSNILGGKQGTSYVGTNANQPPNCHFEKRAPTINDIRNVAVGDFWFNGTSPSAGTSIWQLATLRGLPGSFGPSAQWVNLMTSDITGSLNVAGNLNMPSTTAAGATGVIKFGGSAFIHSYGLNNTFIGSLSGNYTLTGGSCTGCGALTLSSLTTGTNNCAFGDSSGTAITTGTYNTLIGSNSGSAYTTESSNIIIGETAGTAADAAILRIGNDTTPITSAFIQGIRGITPGVTPYDALAVIMDSNYQLGTADAIPWSPVLNFGGATTGITYLAAPVGYYVRTGKIITIYFRIALSSKGTAVGDVTITGFPFTLTTASPLAVRSGAVTFADQLIARPSSVNPVFFLEQMNGVAGTLATLNDTNFANNSDIIVSGTILYL